MNFNFVFISYSVIYAKYGYCYEVPKEQPQRYFDGKEWKIMKPRPNIKPKVPRHSNISVDLDWAELFKEMKETGFEETTTQLPICDITTDITKNVKRANTDTLTTKIPTTKIKMTTKITCTPKIIMKALNRSSLSTTTAKTLLPHCRPVCKLKLKTTTIDPQLLHLKMSTSGDWRDNWSILRPTRKPSLVTTKKYTSKVTKNCYIPTIKSVYETTSRQIVTTTTKNPVTPFKGSVTTTRKPAMPTKRPVITTKKPATSAKRPETTTKAPMTKMEKFPKFSGKSADVANPTGNWPNLLKEFLKYVEEKKCQRPPCEYQTTKSTMPFLGYERIDNRKTMHEDDDLMNILVDGVEIDDRLSEEGEDASKRKEMLEYEGQRINYESKESFSSQINNDYHFQGHKSLKNSITPIRKTGQLPKKMEYLKMFRGKNSKYDFTTSHNRETEINLDQFKDKNESEDFDIFENYEFKSYPGAKKDIETKANSDTQDIQDYMFSEIKRSKIYLDDSKDSKAKENDKVLQANDIKSYSDSFKEKYIKKDYKTSRTTGLEVYSDELIDKNTRKEDEVIGNNVLNYYINALENKHAKKENGPESSDSYLDGENIKQQEEDNYLHKESTEMFNFKELNEVKDYAAPNLIHPTEITSPTNNEDLLQDSDITFDLEDYSIKADKYSENRIDAQKRDSEYAYTFNDLNELK